MEKYKKINSLKRITKLLLFYLLFFLVYICFFFINTFISGALMSDSDLLGSLVGRILIIFHLMIMFLFVPVFSVFMLPKFFIKKLSFNKYFIWIFHIIFLLVFLFLFFVYIIFSAFENFNFIL